MADDDDDNKITDGPHLVCAGQSNHIDYHFITVSITYI